MRVLLTGGRAPVSLDLARMFASQGHTVFVAESQSAQVCRTSNAVTKTFTVPPPRQQQRAFLNALIDITRNEKIDVLIPTCEEVFYLARGRDEFPEHCRVWVDSFTKLSALHDKWRFNQDAPTSGLTTPRSYLVSSNLEMLSYRDLPGRWILKPAFSRFGNHVHQGTLSELLRLDNVFEAGQSWVLQEFISGPEYCTYAVAVNGVLAAISIYDHEFIAGRAGICFEEVDVPQIETDVRDFVKQIKFTGQIAFDFIIQDGRAYALECNPRATSGIHLLARKPEFAQVFTAPPKSTQALRSELGARSMLGLAMLTFALPQINSFSRLGEWFKVLIKSHEVMFSRRDPLPFFDQLICVIQLAWESRRNGLDLLSMSTADIEWNGEA